MYVLFGIFGRVNDVTISDVICYVCAGRRDRPGLVGRRHFYEHAAEGVRRAARLGPAEQQVVPSEVPFVRLQVL